jgi:hypothetical protein
MTCEMCELASAVQHVVTIYASGHEAHGDLCQPCADDFTAAGLADVMVPL